LNRFVAVCLGLPTLRAMGMLTDSDIEVGYKMGDTTSGQQVDRLDLRVGLAGNKPIMRLKSAPA
jgi:hypothetical protein